MSEKKILFRVDSNKNIGYGHFFRSLSLAHCLKDEFHIIFAMAHSDDNIVSILDKSNFTLINLPPKEYSMEDIKRGMEITFDLGHIPGDVDVTLLDGYVFGNLFQRSLRSFPTKIALIEDNGKGSYLADLIINQAPGLNSENYITDNNSCMFALGPEFSLLRPGFQEEAGRDKTYKDKLENILVCFGASDPFNYSFTVSDWILNNTGFNITLVLGNPDSLYNNLLNLSEKFKNRLNIKYSLDEKGMLEVMANSDIGIVPASGVLFESIACKLPVISGMIIENQEQVYKGFRDLNVFFDGKDFSSESLNEVFSLITPDKCQTIRENQKKVIDGFAPERYRELFNKLCLS